MEDQKDVEDKGASMRLGACPCKIEEESHAYGAYFRDYDNVPQSQIIYERHRHRFEFNNAYRDQLSSTGLKISGTNPERDLVEIVEVSGHPWFVGVQFHPEFQSKPNKAHPLFREFVRAALTNQQQA